MHAGSIILALFLLFVDSGKYLSQEQIHFYNENGYIILRQFSNIEEMTVLKREINKMIDGWVEEADSGFSTLDRGQMNLDKFLGSANKIEFFVDPSFRNDGKITVDKHKALNKVGHGLPLFDNMFKVFTLNCELERIAQDLGLASPQLTQTMYIFKQPNGGEAVPVHQDSTYLFTKPKQSCLGFWWAVDDATEENGCLWALPGSHNSKIEHHFRRVYNENGTVELRFENLETGEFFVNNPEDGKEITEEYVPLPMKRGDLVVFSGRLLHASKQNWSAKERHSYQIHMTDMETPWSEYNWMQYPEGEEFLRFQCQNKQEL